MVESSTSRADAARLEEHRLPRGGDCDRPLEDRLRRLADLTAEPFACRGPEHHLIHRAGAAAARTRGRPGLRRPYWSSTTGSGSEGLNAWLVHLPSSHVPCMAARELDPLCLVLLLSPCRRSPGCCSRPSRPGHNRTLRDAARAVDRVVAALPAEPLLRAGRLDGGPAHPAHRSHRRRHVLRGARRRPRALPEQRLPVAARRTSAGHDVRRRHARRKGAVRRPRRARSDGARRLDDHAARRRSIARRLVLGLRRRARSVVRLGRAVPAILRRVPRGRRQRASAVPAWRT